MYVEYILEGRIELCQNQTVIVVSLGHQMMLKT